MAVCKITLVTAGGVAKPFGPTPEDLLTPFPPDCLFVLRFYGPVNPVGSCRARSVYLTC